MRFANSLWLWGVLAAILIGIAMGADWKRRRLQFERSFAVANALRRIIPGYHPSARAKKVGLWTLALVAVCVALARPQAGKIEETVPTTGLDIIFVLDVSNSMQTEDVVPSRIKKAKHAIRNITDQLNGDRAGLVAFAGSAYLASPLTTDLDYFNETLDTLGPGAVVNQGTDIGLALEVAAGAIERAAEGGAKDPGTASRAVILISDGEDFEEKITEGISKVKATGAKVFVMGVGTEKGAPIPIRDEQGALEGYKKDRSGKPVVSRFHPDALQKVAKVADGKYWLLTDSKAEVDEVVASLGLLDRANGLDRKVVTYGEKFQWPLLVAFLFLILEWSTALNLKSKKALVFWVVWGAGVLATPPAQASRVGSYFENKAGIKAYKEGKLEEARKHFGEAQAQSPRSPELLFNQGVIQNDLKDSDSAIASYQSALEGLKKNGASSLEAGTHYNLGDAYEKAQKIPEAIQSFVNAIDAAQSLKNSEIAEQARKRIEHLVQVQKKKQEQQGESKEQEKKDQKSEDDSQKNNKPSESKEGKENQEQNNKKDQNEKKVSNKGKFNSEKLSKEDAERVMAELSNREKALQKKLKKQQGTPKPRESQDW